MKKVSFILLAVSFTSLFGSTCQAILIASDSFATSAGPDGYVADTTILGQSPTAGAPGFVGAWGDPSTQAFWPRAGGLTHPLTPGSTFDGELISFPLNDTVGGGNARNLSRRIDYTPTDGTYYMSVLLRKNEATDRADLLAGLAPLQSPTTGIFSVAGSWIGFVDGGIDVFLGPGATLDSLVSSAAMNVGETYFALLQFEYSTTATDTVTATVFDGSSQQVAHEVYTNLDLDGSLGRFSVLMQDFGPATVVDEWRFGTRLSDVMVPEPASAGLLLVGVAFWFAQHRRR